MTWNCQSRFYLTFYFIRCDHLCVSNNVGQTMLVTNNVGQGHHIRQFDHDIEEQHASFL